MEHRIPTNTAARRATDRLRTAGTRRGRAAAAAPVAARVVYGAALLLAPDAVIGTVAGAPPGDAVRRLGRVLGARHLAQALLTADRPVRRALKLGALVDLLHLASMLGLAVVVPRHRRCALLDAAAAAAWAAAGMCAPRSGAPGGSRTAVGTARNHIASMLAVRR